LHREYLKLKEEKDLAQVSAMAKEEALASALTRCAGLTSQAQAAEERLTELGRELAAHAEAEELASVALGNRQVFLDSSRVSGASAWAHKVACDSISITSESLPMVLLMHQIFSATLASKLLVNARSRGASVSALNACGYSTQDLANVYTHEELIAAGLTAAKLHGAGLGAAQLLKASFSPEDILAAMSVDVPSDGIAQCTYIFSGVSEARLASKELHSKELCFLHAPNPQHRYSFKINILPNGYGEENCGAVSVYFAPRAGATPEALAWPMRHSIRLRVLSPTSEAHKERHIDPTEGSAKTFFEKHAPPKSDTVFGRGFGKMLSREEYESGRFLLSGGLLAVQCILLDAR
jgi:hypothetical protein